LELRVLDLRSGHDRRDFVQWQIPLVQRLRHRLLLRRVSKLAALQRLVELLRLRLVTELAV
jgi:hypothetical protein